MPLKLKIWRWLVVAAMIPIPIGCASSRGPNVVYLLEQDYQRMTDPQLVAYEQELSDEIAMAVAGESPPGVSVGVGFGSWGDHGGIGLGVEKWLGGGSGDAALELRGRSDAVRQEMGRRGLLPR